MAYLRRAAFVALSVALFGSIPSKAAEPIGEAIRIKTQVSGASGPLVVKDPVHRDERIRTSRSGLGQFVFRDGSKLAVGAGSSVVIDRFVFDDSKSVQKLTVTAAKGTFRWISGNSKHTAYEILTPAGTIGVRGTVFDFHIGVDGTTALVLLSGAAEFCGRGGCEQLTRRCDCVVARPNGEMSDARRVDRSILRTLGDQGALPFLSGRQRLSPGWSGTGCGLSAAIQIRPDPDPPRATPPRREVAPPVEKPPKPNKPDKPDRPDRPDRPDKPNRPDGRDRDGPPDRDKPDRPRDSGGDNGGRD